MMMLATVVAIIILSFALDDWILFTGLFSLPVVTMIREYRRNRNHVIIMGLTLLFIVVTWKIGWPQLTWISRLAYAALIAHCSWLFFYEAWLRGPDKERPSAFLAVLRPHTPLLVITTVILICAFIFAWVNRYYVITDKIGSRERVRVFDRWTGTLHAPAGGF